MKRVAIVAVLLLAACDAPRWSTADASRSVTPALSATAIASASATTTSAPVEEPPRYLASSPKCAVPRGMPTWSWDTIMRVDGLDTDAVVLTIDAGARAPNLERELDILRDRSVRATVFLYTGELSKSKTGPDIVKRILADGHELGNHTLSHHDLTKMSDDEVGDEVDAVETFVRDATGATTKPYFRAPFLATNAAVERVLRARCYRSVWISVDSHDDRKGVKADEIVRSVLEERGKPRVFERGAILLLHGSQPENLVALPKVIDGIRERGFEILTLSEALRRAHPPETVPPPHRPLAK